VHESATGPGRVPRDGETAALRRTPWCRTDERRTEEIMNSSHVEVSYRGVVHRRPAGTRVADLVTELDGELPDTVLSALVNRRQVMLDFPLRGKVELDLVRYGDREARSTSAR